MPKKIPPYMKEKAIQLRVEKQMTVPEIAEQLKYARSTVYGWLKDYPLEERTQKQTEAQRKGTEAMQAKYKKIRDDAYELGWEEAPELFKDPFFRDFVNLYLTEGFRRTIHSICVANSNFKIMLMAQYFIKKYANPDNSIAYDVQIHIDQDEEEIQTYWANLMEVEPEEIRISRKSNSGQLSGRNWRSEYGVLTIRIGDTYFRSRMQAWMDYLEKLWLDKYGG